jgi:hypothetical protein
LATLAISAGVSPAFPVDSETAIGTISFQARKALRSPPGPKAANGNGEVSL